MSCMPRTNALGVSKVKQIAKGQSEQSICNVINWTEGTGAWRRKDQLLVRHLAYGPPISWSRVRRRRFLARLHLPRDGGHLSPDVGAADCVDRARVDPFIARRIAKRPERRSDYDERPSAPSGQRCHAR